MTKKDELPKPGQALTDLPTHSAPSIEVSERFAVVRPAQLARISRHQLIYSIAGLVLGVVCMLGGLALFLNGVAGKTNWSAKLFGVESVLSDAAPGAVLFVVGMFVVLITRYGIRVKN